ncbi:MAG: PEGA domain-containing protein [Chitinispirillales bacterium]|jgi:hypothetical protein|nr:PEGA domain-containing protein [Chitinispirillales bacterium]
MTRRDSISTIIILLTAVACFAQFPDPHIIADFNINDTEIVEKGGFGIKQRETDTLFELGYPPQFIRPGEVVVRKKYGVDYKLFLGELDSAAFSAFPPLYSFRIPSWSRAGQIMWYRIYSDPDDKRNLDVETVFFDNERIYVQHHKTIFYCRNDRWYPLHAASTPPFGSLSVNSEPQGADIYINGKSTGQKTPALLENLMAGKHEVELFLPNHHFQRRTVKITNGAITSSSFELMSDFDTLLVLGENQHGILVLPYPPVDSTYRINGSVITSFKEQLPDGEHHIQWRGGDIYKDIDTFIFIPAGKMVYFNVPFERLSGKVTFELEPKDALLCIEGFPCWPGELAINLPSGFHTVRISRYGYVTERRQFRVSHNKVALVKIHLEINTDRDGDGFLDHVDRCPDDYGLYDGCPKPRFTDRVMIMTQDINEYIETEPFSFAVSAIGLINRSPANRRFHNFLSSFSGGRTGGLNNYQGLTIGNIYQASYRGLIGQAELGQWSSGIKFQRPDTLTMKTNNGSYIVWYDSLFSIDPAIFIPSTAISGGFKYRYKNYSIAYSLGYQWEDIIIDQIQRVSDGQFTRVTYDNDWWFHELLFEGDLFTDTYMTPALYAKFKFPFGSGVRTNWHSFQFGLNIRFRPSNWKNS